MEPTNQPRISNRQKMNISSLSLNKDELRRLCNILQERANSAADIEVSLFHINGQTEEQYQENIKTLRNSFQLNITICGFSGEELWGSIDEVFDSVNFPEHVKSLFIDSESTLRVIHNFYPHNAFKIFLDFNKPKIFDLSLLPNNGTPNESSLEVKGYDPTWVNGVFNELKTFIANRSSTLSVVHNHSVYDILLFTLGFPLSFWVCSKVSLSIDKVFGGDNTFVTSALYLYTFISTLFIFRILFHYLRWVCPLVEYKTSNNKMLIHRSLLATIIIGCIVNFITDIAKWLINT
ncbi:hypothetical protein P0C22_07685 [Plesiomonas shigelloides]|uniref:hypothetical protein n=1 Tax=Plesiomonas shigelloides TaxID=703 RepID=UPI0030C21269